MVDIEKISEELEVQSDIFKLGKDELVAKYTTSIGDFNNFLIGASTVIDRYSFGWFFRERGYNIGEVLLIGHHNTMEGIDGYQDTFFKSMKEKYNSLKNYEEMYHAEKHVYPDYSNKICDQYYCIQSSNIGMRDSRYVYFLIKLPTLFEGLMSRNGTELLDVDSLNTIAYIALHYPSVAIDDDFKIKVGDLSRRRIRKESVYTDNPSEYRRAGRCARKWMERRNKALLNESVKVKLF